MTQTLACREFEEMAFVERYLLKRLSPAEQEAFEAHFLSCESCQKAIELGIAIRRTLPPVEAVPSRRSWVTLGAGLGLAAAAGLAAVLLLSVLRTLVNESSWYWMLPRNDRLGFHSPLASLAEYSA